MRLTKARLGALCFLAFTLGYALMIGDIPTFPGDEYEPFTAKSLPTALSWCMAVVSFLRLILPDEEDEGEDKSLTHAFANLEWGKVATLCALMTVYGLTLTTVGFVISTIFFLAGGMAILGERRPVMLLAVPGPIVICFWALLTQLLGIYLAPGTIFGG